MNLPALRINYIQPLLIVSSIDLPPAQALIHRMRTKPFSHAMTITLGLIQRRPTRLAILLSILGLLTLGVTFSLNYIRSNFVGTFGPATVYTHVNASTSPEGVSLSRSSYPYSMLSYSSTGCPVRYVANPASRIDPLLVWQLFGHSIQTPERCR